MEILPALSITIVNRNSAPKMRKCLDAISRQNYPKDKIETLVIDGGSTDESRQVAEEYGARFIEGGFPDNMEARRHIGVQNAANEIIVILDTDNYLPETNWLRRMVRPLMEDQEIFASQTLHYAYVKNETCYNRYCSLFGFNDPVAFYLNKADRMTHFQTAWKLGGKAEDKGDYYKVKFTEENLPTVGCNGFLIRRAVIEKILTEPENFFHIDVILDLLKLGYDRMAFVKNDIIHQTSDNLSNLIRKRLSYFKNHSVELVARRRYRLYDTSNMKDNLLLLRYILYTITIIKPVYDAARGYIKKPDKAWFLHPVVCLMFLYVYGYTVIRKTINNKLPI